MSGRVITPALGDKSFTCPHCGALSHQTWYKGFLDGYRDDQYPWMPADDAIERVRNDSTIKDSSEIIKFFERKLAKELFIERHDSSCYSSAELANLSISHCFSCEAFSLWVADDLIYPEINFSVLPNEDMPPAIKADFIEADSIFDRSPRGAAALLRLCLQKLTAYLGLKGKKLDEDIGALVKKGLDPRVQKALDVVRVVGNQAVHPGQIDLRDDKATAAKLFNLVNVIVEATISTPKHIDAMFETLPEGALKAIERRDGITEESKS